MKRKTGSGRKRKRHGPGHAKRENVSYSFRPARSASVHAPASSLHSCGPPSTHQTLPPLRHLRVFKQSTQTNNETDKILLPLTHFIYLLYDGATSA